MKAKLKSLVSGNFDLRVFSPENPSFHIPAEMEVGPSDGHGADIFQLEICSPKWLECHLNIPSNSLEEAQISWVKRPFLMVRNYSYCGILDFLQEFVAQVDGPSWTDLANKINKVALWEFDKYRH